MLRNYLAYAFLILASTWVPLTDAETTPSATFYKKPASTSKKIWFQFKDEPLTEAINYLAQIMKINVILPAGEDALTQKLTFQLPEKITISTAWEHVLTILKVAGYSIIDQNNFYYVKKNGANINKEQLPLYVQTPSDQLPDDDQRIRLLYYFSNINVSGTNSGGGFGGSGSTAPISTVLQNMLSASASFMLETTMNAVIISDYARNIRSAMALLERLDVHGPTEHVIIMQLKNTNASMVAQLFQQLIPSSGTQTQNDAFSGAGSLPTAPTTAESQYFSQSTRIVAIPRTNSLVIMGKKEALEHIKNFIKTHIDIQLKQGECVIHIYPLEYMDAQTLAPILQTIVSNSQSGSSGGNSYGSSTGQSTTSTTGQGNERFFNGVIIMAEPVSQGNSTSGSGQQSTWWTTSDSIDASVTAPPPSQRGGNRLIVAATQDDWTRIKKLIQELDIPQPQIALEVLVVDLTVTGLRVLGSQIRDLQALNWKNIHGQTSNLGNLVITGNPNATAANALQSDLLEPITTGGSTTLANQATAGSLIMALRDSDTNTMWMVAQLLRKSNYAKILAQPFAIALNNQLATFGTTDTRILPGNATVVKGANVVQLASINAKINLAIQPRISDNGNINLGLNISISSFTSAVTSDGTQATRQITTNANVRDGEVLILGGLTKDTLSAEELEVPILGQIPLLRWFFARKQKTETKDDLMIFICAKKLEPSASAFYDIFTGDKISHATNVLESHGETFDSLRDPINRWFFGAKDAIRPKTMTTFKDKGHLALADKHKYKEEFLYEKQIKTVEPKESGFDERAAEKEQELYKTLLDEYIGQAEETQQIEPVIPTKVIAKEEAPQPIVKKVASHIPQERKNDDNDFDEEAFKKMLQKLPKPT